MKINNKSIFAINFVVAIIIGLCLSVVNTQGRTFVDSDSVYNKFVNNYYFNNTRSKTDILLVLDSLLTNNLFSNDSRAHLLLIKGKTLHEVSRFYEAKKVLDKSLCLVDKNNDTIVARIYLNIGIVLKNIGETDSASAYYKRAIDLYQSAGDSIGMARVLSNYAIHYSSVGNYELALTYSLQSNMLYSSSGKKEEYLKSLINTANIYDYLKQYNKAIELYNKVSKLAKQSNAESIYNKALLNMGVINYHLEKYDKSLELFLEALNYYNTIDDKRELSLLYSNISLIQRKRNNYNASIQYLLKSLSLSREIRDMAGIIRALNNLSIIHQYLKQYNIAKQYLFESLKYSQTSGYKKDMMRSYKNLSNLYDRIENKDSALFFYRLYHQMSDSILNQTKIEKIAELQAKYEKKEDEVRILNLERLNTKQMNSNQKLMWEKNVILIIGISTLLLLLLLLFLYRYRYNKNKLIANQKIRLLEDEKQLIAAQSILAGQEEERKRISQELHDGIGVLLSSASIRFSNITGLLDEENSDELKRANQMLQNASNEVRKISQNMMPGVLTNFGLFDAIEDLFEDVNESSNINVEYIHKGYRPRLKDKFEIMIYRIVQEMVNNSLKHANPQNITLSTELTKKELLLKYSDDGIGFNMNEISKGLGLSGISSRIDFLSGRVNIKAEPNLGCRFNIVIPVE